MKKLLTLFICTFITAANADAAALSAFAQLGRAASAECAFAMAPGTRAIYDGRRVYLVSGCRVAELDNAALVESAGQRLADNGMRVRAGGSRAPAAVGCTMRADCWNSINAAIDAQASWESAEAAKAEAAAEKDKG